MNLHSGVSTSQIAQAMLSLRPALGAEVAAASIDIADNLSQVVDAALMAARDARNNDKESIQSVIEGLAYIRDACITLCAFARACPSMAPLIVRQSRATLLETLGHIHDHLVPGIEDTFVRNSRDKSMERVSKLCLHVELASETAAARFLLYGILQSDDIGDSGAGSSSGKRSQASIARGEALLNVLSLLGHREGPAVGGVPVRDGGLSLAPALARRHDLAGTIQEAMVSGSIALDDAQADYLAALMDLASLGAAPVNVQQHTEHAEEVQYPTDGASLKVVSAVSQVRDVLPEYGDGFIAACLEAFAGDAERTLNALLEGSLPSQCAHLDKDLTLQQYYSHKTKSSASELPQPSMAALGGQAATQPRRQTDSLTAKYLDTKESAYSRVVKAVALDSQWEYEDEYDDSFDELLHIGADGVAEGEGEGDDASLDQGARTVASVIDSLALEGDEEPLREVTPSRAPLGVASQGARGKGSKVWVLEGHLYNYKKPGAQEVGSQEEAHALIQRAQEATLEIHGLGPGGNVPLQPRLPASDSPGHSNAARGRGRGGRGGGGRGHPDHKWKDKHKAAVGNHHRKDRAVQKASRGMQ